MKYFLQIIWRQTLHPRMPTMTSHLNTNANHVNDNEENHDKSTPGNPRI